MMDLPLFICLGLTLFAGLYDLKTSDVHPEVPALLISIGLFYWYMFSLMHANFKPLLMSFFTGIFFLFVGYLFYKARIWGDGDFWLLGGMGFLLSSPENSFFTHNTSFLLNLLFIGGIYSLIYVLVYGAMKPKVRKDFILRIRKHFAVCIGFLLPCVIFSLYFPPSLLFGIFPPIYIYLKVVEREMKRKIKTNELREGDVIAGKEICGLTREEIEEIKRSKKYVEIQEGVRFSMVFPLTLIFVYFFGGIFGVFLMISPI